MRLLKSVQTILQNPAYLGTLGRRAIREFRFFDYDYQLLDGYSFSPTSICLILTESCNLKCRMCDIGQRNERQEGAAFSPLTDAITRGDDEMTLADWKRLLDEIAGMNGRPLVLLTGTEPLLYPRMLELLEHGLSRGINFHITTNGTLLQRCADQLVALCTRPDALRITISLDGIGDVHDTIRGVKGTFDRAIAGLHALDTGKRKDNKAWPEVTINYTISNHNHTHIRDFIDWFYHHDYNVHGINFSHLWFKDASIVEKHNKRFADEFPVQEENTGAVDLAAIDMMRVHEQLAAGRNGGPRLPFYIAESPPLTEMEARLYYQSPTQVVFYDKCLAPWRNVAINPNGEVIISPLCFAGTMGNVKKSSFSRVWNGDSFRRFRRKLQKVGIYPACSRCCMLFDSKPKYYKIRQML
jgi:MoaA/NifB/PqqE/SkfB family radical SAM enzyme